MFICCAISSKSIKINTISRAVIKGTENIYLFTLLFMRSINLYLYCIFICINISNNRSYSSPNNNLTYKYQVAQSNPLTSVGAREGINSAHYVMGWVFEWNPKNKIVIFFSRQCMLKSTINGMTITKIS